MRAVASPYSPTASAAGNSHPVPIWVFVFNTQPRVPPSAPDFSNRQMIPPDLYTELLPQLSEFNSAVDITQFLALLLVLVTKGRISPRRASVLAYITNQLLLLA